MLRTIPFLVLVLVFSLGPHCKACNLTQTAYDEATGLLHRCLNTTGTNEWHMEVACWLRPLGSASRGIKELDVGENYKLADGRKVAECRSRYRGSGVALVYLACLNVPVRDGVVMKWPGDVWTGTDGMQYTCTNASKASSSSYYRQGSRVVLFACNSSSSGRLIAPGSTELQVVDGIVSKCEFSGTEVSSRYIGYALMPVGCGLRSLSNPGELVRLEIDQEYFLPSAAGQVKRQLAVCKKKNDGKMGLVYTMCLLSNTTGNVLRQPGDYWTVSENVMFECLPAKPGELVSANVVRYGCYQNGILFMPGSEVRISDGSIVRCTSNKYRSVYYDWHEYVGCWLKDPLWSKFANHSFNLRAGEDFCSNICLASCVKHRYRDQVALVAKVCFISVGNGVIYRQPNEYWTDDNGFNRTCLPMPDQYYDFGVGAMTILIGCQNKSGPNTVVPPGTLLYDQEFIVRQCAFNKYRNEFKFNEMKGCWMHNANGQRVRIADGQSYTLHNGKVVATCRKKSSDQVTFTLNVCFKSKQLTPLNWKESEIAFPGDRLDNGSLIIECNRAAVYSDGVHARWIVYGCPSKSGVVAPGVRRLFDDGIIRNCSHNGRDSSPAYDWSTPTGCWFLDHMNQSISITQFNIVFNHPEIGKPTAVCKKDSYSDPKLLMLVCLSTANRRYYTLGEKWMDSNTKLSKQCVRTSCYPRDCALEVDAGCWLQAPKTSGGNSPPVPLSHLLAGNGSFAYGSENRVLRCDLDDYYGKFEWKTGVACWYDTLNGTRATLSIRQEFWSNGKFMYKCLDTRKGAKFVQYSCKHNGTWYDAMSTWRDSSYQYKCLPASGDQSAKVEKTHCITDDGTAIVESKIIKGIQYVCMRICAILVFFRDPKPEHYRLLNSLISNCNAINIGIINSIG